MPSSSHSPVQLGTRCTVCRGPLEDGSCPNAACRLPDREFSSIYTVSEDAEATWRLIHHFKYDEEKVLAEPLGRMLAEFLEKNRAEFERFDILTPVALYIGPDAPRLWDYLQLILEATQSLDDSWPFEKDVIIKVGVTGRFLGIGVEERRAIAEGELRNLLQVPTPARVEGKRVLVIDDAYSEGFTMREMARALRRAGAAEVAGLVLTRRKGA